MNTYWRSIVMGRSVRVLLSKEGRAYKSAVATIFAMREYSKPVQGSVRVTMHLYRARKSGDLDNRIKALLDALKGLAFVDDDQVVEIHAYRYDDKANPRVEVAIEPVS